MSLTGTAQRNYVDHVDVETSSCTAGTHTHECRLVWFSRVSRLDIKISLAFRPRGRPNTSSSSSIMADLVDLPPELVISILLYLYLHDIAACQLTSSIIYHIIANSTQVQYHIATLIAGVESNVHLEIGISSRTERLDYLENGWNQLKSNFSQEIEFETDVSSIQKLTDGVYFYGATIIPGQEVKSAKKKLCYFNLPSGPEEKTCRKEIHMENGFVEFAAAVNEHDLIAVGTPCVPFPL